MRNIKKIINGVMILGLMAIPTIVNADSGLDSNYQESGSIVGGIINAVLSLISFFTKIFEEQPGGEDYYAAHTILAIICIITIFIVTAVYIFKFGKKKKGKKYTFIKLGIALIPTIIFALVCFLTELQLIIYFLIAIAYITMFIIISKIVLKKRLKNEITKLKELDKNFNEENFGKEAFNIYKEVQLAWCNFELNRVKELISEEMYNEYTEKLEELKKNNQKNIMSNFEFESNTINDITVEENIEIACTMKVKCYDCIVDKNDKIIKGKKEETNKKGKKNKKYNYKYQLIFRKNLKDTNYILVKKKMSNM